MLARRWLHTDPGHPRRSLDVIGLSLLSPALAAIVYGICQAGGSGGSGAPVVLCSLAAGAVLLAAFARHSLKAAAEPLVDLRLFRVATFRASSAIMFIGGLSLFGSMLLLPLYEQ